jgi:molybdopterin converting factor small subunit
MSGRSLLNVRVRVPTQLRDLVAGAAVVELTVEPPSDASVTVAGILDAMATQHPALERRIRDEQGRARPHVNLFVDSDNVRDRDGLATPIRAGEELSIIPAVSGG